MSTHKNRDRILLLKRRIRTGYGISFLLLLFSFCLIFYVQWRLMKESDRIMRSYDIVNTAESLKSELTSAETGMRGYIITKDTLYLKPYTAALRSLPSLGDQLKRLTADNHEQQEKMDTLQNIITRRMGILRKGLADFQTNGFVVTDEFRSRLDSGMNTMDSAKRYIAHFRETEESLMQSGKTRLSGFFNGARLMAVISLVIVLFALLYSMVSFNRTYHAREVANKTANEYKSELNELRDLEKFTSTGRIARTIAHEVRNPLTNILLATEQLREVGKNGESSVLLELINRNASRINHLVSDLLNATRFSHLDFTPVNINQLMEEALELAKDRLDLSNVQVEKNYSPAVCEIFVDKEKIKVALLNIIVNAVEAMEKERGVLELTTRKQHNKCIIEIKDNGKGMDEEELQKLFEPYFTSKVSGNGLGLTNTQNIILNHNGTIHAYSKPGNGALFVITLEIPEKHEQKN